jgi:hypothetical protein
MELELNENLIVEIDAEDLHKVLQITTNWFFNGRRVSCKKNCGKASLAAIILNYFGNLVIDHIDGNPLNNKKDNLRVVTHQQNSFNSKSRKNSSSKFKNVCWDRQAEKWKVNIKVKGNSIHGGHFDCEIEAARKANELMLKHHGEFARLNAIPELN